MNLMDQIKQICETMHEGFQATPQEINAVLRIRMGIEIGEGGKGTNPRVLSCPYCGAYGGGGHGGFCPGP